MNRDDLIKNNQINFQRLIEFGFKKEMDIYTYQKILNNSIFYAVFQISEQHFDIHVYDKDFDEIYMPFEIKTASGKFVSQIRDEIETIILEIQSYCLREISLKDDILKYIKQKYDVTPVYPWKDSPSHGTFKTLNSNKWFGLIMHLPYEKLGASLEGKVDVMNLKLRTSDIEKLIDHKHYFPAYHMNKKYWLSVVLDKEMPLETICQLIDESYRLVEK